MIEISARADELGIGTLTAAVHAAVTRLGGSGEAAALAVRVAAEDAARRLSGGEEAPTLTVSLEVTGAQAQLQFTDRGSPVQGVPEPLLALLEFGALVSVDAASDGHGNRTSLVLPLPGHSRLLDLDAVEVYGDDVELSAEAVSYRALEPGDATGLTRAIYRTYGWSYPLADLYYPERIAAAIESGTRVGEVAVTAEGEVVSHWGAVFLAPGVVETGNTVTDPRFRRRGLAKDLGDRLLERLGRMGVRGRLREPVMTHSATQAIALQEGASIVGCYIHMTNPLQQVGITDGVMRQRGSASVMYVPLQPLRPAKLWVPPAYSELVAEVLRHTDWPRTVEAPRAHEHVPLTSALATAYDATNHLGVVTVTRVGADLVTVLDENLHAMRKAGSEWVSVRLPLTQEPTGTLGAGLSELGLSFGALLPEFLDGEDCLALQWLADREIDTAEWVYADDRVAHIVDAIVQQARDVGERDAVHRRRAARRAALLAPLG